MLVKDQYKTTLLNLRLLNDQIYIDILAELSFIKFENFTSSQQIISRPSKTKWRRNFVRGSPALRQRTDHNAQKFESCIGQSGDSTRAEVTLCKKKDLTSSCGTL